MIRKSPYPMLSVDEALSRILDEVRVLPSNSISILDSIGCYASEAIIARESVPMFPTSIMDGYAVKAPLHPGIYNVQERVYAGLEAPPLSEG